MMFAMTHKRPEPQAIRVVTICTIALMVVTLQTLQELVGCQPHVDSDSISAAAAGGQATEAPTPAATTTGPGPAECAVFADYGKNYLTPIDVVVMGSNSNVACIRARFALSIKVEEAQFNSGQVDQPKQPQERPILGYVPLERVLSVEMSCPDSFTRGKTDQDGDETNNNSTNSNNEKSNTNETTKQTDTKDLDDQPPAADDELEMIVTFDCGKLSFTFRRDRTKIYISAIKGIVKLDKRVVREFIAVRPMFSTSDLDHHFKYDDEIEVVSEVQSKAHILTANFFFTEIEAFRNTTSRDFTKPPDEKSKPFLDETETTQAKLKAGK